MQILIDQLTRMAAGYICVAGLDEERRHVRPVLEGRRLTTNLLSSNGGPFAIGSVVEMGETRRAGVAPEVEDRTFDPEAAHRVEQPDPQRLWEALHDDAELLLVDIFGHDIHKDGRCATVPTGAGRASLGTLAPGYRPEIRTEDGKIRCCLVDPDLGELNLSVTDVRLYRDFASDWVVDDRAVANLKAAMASERPALLSVGLGRPWPKNAPRHWLQVNNIHLDPGAPKLDAKPSETGSVIDSSTPTVWTDEQDHHLIRLYRTGRPLKEIVNALGLARSQIISRLRDLDLAD